MKSMLEDLTKIVIDKKKFSKILESLFDILCNEEKLYNFMRLESFGDVFEFLQIHYPGDYSEDELVKTIVISILAVYFESKSFARNCAFLYTINDMKKHTNVDLNEIFYEISSRYQNSKNDPSNFDDYINVSGGAGKGYHKFAALGLAFLTPLASPDVNRWLQPSIYATNPKNRKKRNSKKTNQTEEGVEKLSLWQRIKNSKWTKPVIAGSLAIAAVAAFWFGWAKPKLIEKAANESFEKDKNKLVYDEIMNQINDIPPGEEKNATFMEDLKKALSNKEGVVAGPFAQIDFTNKYTLKKAVKHANKDETLGQFAKQILGDKWIEKEKEDRKNKVNVFDCSSLVKLVGVLSVLKGGMESVKWVWKSATGFLGEAKAIPEAISKSFEAVKSFRDYVEAQRYALEMQKWDSPTKTDLSVNAIETGLNAVIKGQHAQLHALAEVLASFNMKSDMASTGNRESQQGVLDSAQVNSQCVFLTGPSGTGKSLVSLMMKQFLSSNVRYVTVNLNGYNGGGVNAFLSKNKKIMRDLGRCSNKHTVVIIEEIDKVSKGFANDIAQWMHNVHDSGDIGGGGETNPVHLGGTLFIATSNELPALSLLEAGKVKGLNIVKDGKVITQSNKKNALDILISLSKNVSRELPVERSGSLWSRSIVIEFNQTDDQAMKEIIEMHINELNDKISEISDKLNIDIRYSDKLLDKLAKLRNTLVYKDGGSRTLINDVLSQTLALVNNSRIINIIKQYESQFEPDEDFPPCELWLDYVGLGEDGKLKIDLKATEDEATCEGEVPDIYDATVEGRNPEVALYIQGLILKEFNTVLETAESAIETHVVENWDSVLTDENKKAIDKFLSMVATKLPASSNDKLKLLVSNRVKLVKTLATRGISIDSDWKLIGGLKNTIDSINERLVIQNKLTQRSKTAVENLSTNLNKLKEIRTNKCFKDNEEDFVNSNKNAISQIYGFVVTTETNDKSQLTIKQQFDALLNVKETDLNKLNLTSNQCATVERFSSSLSSEITKVKKLSNTRAKEITSELTSLKKIVELEKDFDANKFIAADKDFLNYLASTINIEFASDNISDQIETLVFQADKIEKSLISIGVSDDDMRALDGIMSRIYPNDEQSDTQ